MEDLPRGSRRSERRRELRLEPIRMPQPGRQEEEGFVKGSTGAAYTGRAAERSHQLSEGVREKG